MGATDCRGNWVFFWWAGPWSVQFHSVQLLSHVWLFATPWIEARQASLSITNYQSLLKLMSVESVMPSNHLILCHPLLLLPSIFPSIRVFSMSQFVTNWQTIVVSASASVIPMNIQDWFPLGWTGWISLQSKEFSRVFSNTTVQKHQFFGIQPSLWYNSPKRSTWMQSQKWHNDLCLFPRQTIQYHGNSSLCPDQ